MPPKPKPEMMAAQIPSQSRAVNVDGMTLYAIAAMAYKTWGSLVRSTWRSLHSQGVLLPTSRRCRPNTCQPNDALPMIQPIYPLATSLQLGKRHICKSATHHLRKPTISHTPGIFLALLARPPKSRATSHRACSDKRRNNAAHTTTPRVLQLRVRMAMHFSPANITQC